MNYSLQFRDVFAAWEFLLDGLVLTLELSLVTMIVGLIIGLAGAAGRVYGPKWVSGPIAVYVEAIRNTPLIVQLFLIFFGLPSAGLKFDADTAAMVALSINLGAYTIEIIRAGLEAIPRSQIEAGQSLGLSNVQIFRYVVIFPALRLMFPALASQFILLMLATRWCRRSRRRTCSTPPRSCSRAPSATSRSISSSPPSISPWRWSSACCSPASTS